MRTRLNKNSLVFGAEVDCCTLKDGKVIAPDSYIELKTSRIIESPRQMRNFANFKMKKFWAQSYLAGVPKIICGMRDDDGIVRELQDYKTLELPKIAASHDARWEASVCLNFLDEFLEWVKNVVEEDNRRIVYSFRFESPFNLVHLKKLTDPEACFLPQWY